jgi:hypothetical protein
MGGNQPYHNQSFQAERRQVLANDVRVRREGTTYHKLAQAEQEIGGRFAVNRPKPQITGTSASQVPPQPDGSPWRTDPVPDEEPLGFSVEEMPVVGEPHESVASEAPALSVASPDRHLSEPRVSEPPTAARGSRSFKRRI